MVGVEVNFSLRQQKKLKRDGSLEVNISPSKLKPNAQKKIERIYFRLFIDNGCSSRHLFRLSILYFSNLVVNQINHLSNHDEVVLCLRYLVGDCWYLLDLTHLLYNRI